MATINYTWTVDSDTPGNPIHIITWAIAAGAADDVGQPFEGAYLADKTVQLLGTLGTFALQGSNDGTNWHTLDDTAGQALTETGGARTKAIAQNPRYIRPNASGAADGVTVILVGRQAKV